MTNNSSNVGTRTSPRVVATDVGFAEGPLHTATGQTYFTSITHGRLYRLTDHGAEVAADLGGGANGAAVGADGSIYVAQNGGRWASGGPGWPKDSLGGVQVLRPTGDVDWVHRDPVAPNDLCFGPDGLLYVTDPTRSPHSADGRLWRIDTDTAEAELLMSTDYFPNGIGFGLDDRLYVASTYESRILAYRLEDGKLTDEQTVVQMDSGHPDGFTFDTDGNLIICAIDLGDRPGAIQTWSMAGKKLDEYVPGPNPRYTNIVLDGSGKMTICDSDGGRVLIIDDWGSAGLELHPQRNLTRQRVKQL